MIMLGFINHELFCVVAAFISIRNTHVWVTIVWVTVGMSSWHPEGYMWYVDRSPGSPRRWICVKHVQIFSDRDRVVSVAHLELIVPLLPNVYSTKVGISK